MCFSASASFALSGVLVGVGAASLARNSSTPYRLFAATPLLFAVQQASEGIVWLTIDMPAQAALLRGAVATFLGLALVVWPTWAPYCIRLIERDPQRQRILSALCWFGALVSLGALFLLVRADPVAHIAGHSMAYDYGGAVDGPAHAVVLVAYILPTVIPFFLSTAPLVRTIGATLVLSVSATAFIRQETLTSTWCFFAAILSTLILVAVNREHPAAEHAHAEQRTLVGP